MMHEPPPVTPPFVAGIYNVYNGEVPGYPIILLTSEYLKIHFVCFVEMVL